MSQILPGSLIAPFFRGIIAESYAIMDGGLVEPKWMGAGTQFKASDPSWPTRSGLVGYTDGRSCDGWTPGASSWEWTADPAGAPTTKLIAGITRDANGNPLGNCTVKVHRTSDGLLAWTGTSNALGYFEAYVPDTSNYYIVSFKAGSPDTAGATDNNIAGV